MKKIMLSLAIVLSNYYSFAQFSSGGGITTTFDNVGVGTTSPQSILDIGKNRLTPAFRIGNSSYGTGYNSVWGLQAGAQSIMIFGNNGQNEIRAGNTVAGGYLDFYTNNTADYTSASNGNFAMRLASNGCVGVGTTNPARPFVVSNGTDGVEITPTVSGGYANIISFNRNTSTWSDFKISASNIIFGWGSTETNEAMRINSSGNVLIGKASQQPNVNYRLDINGSARANEIVVNTSGADFVFDKTYTLPKLSDVKDYIDKNQHLPEIPSAKEMQTNGVELGEMNKKLLQKVEELTLYLIDKDRQDKEKDVKLAMLQKQKNEQNSRILALEKALSKLTSNQSK